MTGALAATVIVPTTGDRGPLLPLTVGSVLGQSVEALEVFVIGDGVGADTRDAVADLVARDERVRFFDHPKDRRRAERQRHAALAEARGRIVCYLTDRDLMLPHHVEVLCGLLEDADLAHTLRFGIAPDGAFGFRHTIDLTDPAARADAPNVKRLIPLSFVGHTLDVYRRLPHGWRTTPLGVATDRFMWLQFLAQAECRVATSEEPTVLYFKRGDHPGWSVERRRAELLEWTERMAKPGAGEELVRQVEDARAAETAREDEAARRPTPAVPRPGLLRRVRGKISRSLKPTRKARDRILRYLREEPRRTDGAHIRECQSRSLGENLRLDVYWVSGELGPGPAASLCAFDDEVLRLDCFGGQKGHMHLNLKQTRLVPHGGGARLKFPTGSVEEHVARATFELIQNARYALRTNLRRRIRDLEPSEATLLEAGVWMERRMLELVAHRRDELESA